LTIALIVPLLAVTACPASETHTTILTEDWLPPAVGVGEAPDDIVITPGGIAYRANVHHQGEENPWPSIKGSNVTLSNWFSEINLNYREHIETGAGETRNNIFRVSRESGFHEGNLNLYAASIPSGIELTQRIGGVMPGILLAVLVIEISPDVAPGQYSFEIGLEVNGRDYGTVPCTIEVVGE
jgi:hypothetical protein